MRAGAAVLAKVADVVVKAADAVPVRVGDAVVKAVDAVPAKAGVARARAEEALVKADGVKADADLAREASRRVIRRLLRSRVPKVPRRA